MLERFLQLIGIHDDVLKHLDRSELMFQRIEVLWIGMVFLLPLAFVVYRRQKLNLHTVPKWLMATLCVTRVSILALMMLVLSAPYLRIDHKYEKQPIVAVPVGSPKRLKDVSIVDLYTSGHVSVGDMVRVAVTLESNGFNGRQVKVELKDGEKVLDTKELVLLGKDSEPDVLAEAEWRRLSAEDKATKLPSDVKALSEYHTIIIGDASPDLLHDEFCKALIEAVRDKGVGLIVEAGPRFMPHLYDREFQSLLPVLLRSNATQGLEAPAYKPFKIEITAEGLLHESLRLHDDPGRNVNVWAQMPSYFWCAWTPIRVSRKNFAKR